MDINATNDGKMSQATWKYAIHMFDLQFQIFRGFLLGIIAEIQLKVVYITSIKLNDFVGIVILFNDDVVTLVFD